MRALIQEVPGSPLTEQALTPEQEEDRTLLEVEACSPSVHDLNTPGPWPRVPGGVFAGRDAEGRRWICGGLIPCGECLPCQAAHHEACASPYLPGASAVAPGGLASHVALPRSDHLAPLEMDGDVVCAVALVAAAGLTYQATASAGMVPGDTVYVVGEPGPGALPLRILVALGLCPVWIGGEGEPPDGVLKAEGAGDLPEVSSPRGHTVCLSASDHDLEQALTLAARCLTITYALPSLPAEAAAPLDGLLAGAATARWIRHLHPHLVLDVVALALSGELDVSPHLERCSMEEMPDAWDALARRETSGWPVLLPN